MAEAHSYAQYLDVIDQLGLGTGARGQAFRRVVFNVAAVNRDDHTKNIAFLLAKSGEWSLAPAYDLTHAHNPSGEWTNQHQMSVNGKRSGIGLDDLYEFGDRFRIPDYRQVTNDVIEAVDRWDEFAEDAAVDEGHVTRIAGDLAAARPA